MIKTTGSVYDIPDVDLLKRVLTNMAHKKSRTWLWVRVKETFGLGSTYSQQLCIRFGFDPEMKQKDSQK